jgi:arylsulfatase A-like enzyme
VKNEGYVTDVITDLSLNWLKQRDSRKPFLLMLQHKAPHRPWEPNVKHLNHDGGRKYPEPATLFDDYAGRGKAEREQDMTIAKTLTPNDLKFTPRPALNPEQKKLWDDYYGPRNEEYKNANLQGPEQVRWKYQRYLHDYLGCIRSVDENVGRVLDYLKEAGLETNTIVVYASDQGFFMGEHGWFDKRWIFEESLRTPLLVRWPGVTKPGSTNRDIVSNLDFAETFLDAAGLPIPGGMQGRSLVPLLAGKTPTDWRKSFYYHYYEHPAEHSVARHYGVVTDRYKLVYFYEPGFNYWELFDRQQDPQELKNVFGQTDYAAAQKELEAELARLRTTLKVPLEDPAATLTPRQQSPRRPANR